jgi:histidyl-tRNA synthetase
MKVDINEVFFLKEAMKSVNIKASDAPTVSRLVDKIDKEFMRLQKLEESKTAQ